MSLDRPHEYDLHRIAGQHEFVHNRAHGRPRRPAPLARFSGRPGPRPPRRRGRQRIGEQRLDQLLATQTAALSGWPTWAIVTVVTIAMVFLTELTSNTATAATFLPLLAGIAPGLGCDPLVLAVPAALAASCAFMLPVATLPNAVIFSSGELRIRDMCRTGRVVNLLAIAAISSLVPRLLLPLLR